jgi:hypothetical protein
VNSRQPEIDAAFVREARIGLTVVGVLLAIFFFVAYARYSGWTRPSVKVQLPRHKPRPPNARRRRRAKTTPPPARRLRCWPKIFQRVPLKTIVPRRLLSQSAPRHPRPLMMQLHLFRNPRAPRGWTCQSRPRYDSRCHPRQIQRLLRRQSTSPIDNRVMAGRSCRPEKLRCREPSRVMPKVLPTHRK